jgi:hypothetical protein
MKLRLGCVATAFFSLVLSMTAQTTSGNTVATTAAAATTAQVPRLVRFSGTATDIGGNAASRVVGVTFSLYAEQTGGAPLWSEVQNVQVNKTGHYTVMLGSSQPDGLPLNLSTAAQAQWLGVRVEAQAEQPRVMLLSVPYVLKAADAETFGGKPPSAFLSAPSSVGSAEANSAANRLGLNTNVKNEHPLNLTGSGTTNYVPLWTNASNLTSSVIYQTSGNVGVGTTTPVTKLDVNGNINTAATYGIGASIVVNIGSPADQNLFLGVGAGANDVAGFGQFNTFSGYQAGYSNTTGSYNTFSGGGAGFSNTTGSNNTFSGRKAGFSNTTGPNNTFFGRNAGYSNTTGGGNTFSGWQAGYSNTTGGSNTFSGLRAGYSNTTGWNNSFSGDSAGYSNTTGTENTFSARLAGYSNTNGTENTFSGYSAGYYNTTGSNNTFSGAGAGYSNTTGNNNIYIGNPGSAPGTESNTIRIGGDIGYGSQTAAYIVGIYGSTSSGGVPVYINSNGQLGTQISSLRFKEQVRDMGDSTNALMKLRPVTFFYKPEYDKGPRTLQYGLIAEEVAKVYPEMVAYDNDGQPYTVKYQYLAPMLLNELQKQHTVVTAQQDVIKTQQEQIQTQGQQIADLQERLSRLESLIANK